MAGPEVFGAPLEPGNCRLMEYAFRAFYLQRGMTRPEMAPEPAPCFYTTEAGLSCTMTVATEHMQRPQDDEPKWYAIATATDGTTTTHCPYFEEKGEEGTVEAIQAYKKPSDEGYSESPSACQQFTPKEVLGILAQRGGVVKCKFAKVTAMTKEGPAGVACERTAFESKGTLRIAGRCILETLTCIMPTEPPLDV